MSPALVDPELIYAKTAAGEEAMLQRTRVVQRNVRMVLILVDGNATVAELCDKTGNAELTQSALRELEDDGFIERRADEDSVWVQGRKLARQVSHATEQPASEYSGFGDSGDSAAASRSLDGEATRIIAAPEKRLGRPSLGEPSSSTPPPSLPAPTDSLTGPESRTVFYARDEAAPGYPAVVAPAATAPQRPSLGARLRALLARASGAEGPDLKPLLRRSLHLTWPMVLLLGLLGTGVLLALLALLFPYGRYLPAVEAAVAASTGQKASIGEMSVTVYPRPGLLLGDVRVGDAAAGDQVTIAEVRLRPVLDTLFSSRLVFQEMELRGLNLSAKGIDSLSRMFRATAHDGAGFGVMSVSIADAAIAFAGLGFDHLGGELVFSPDGLLQAVALRSPDRGLQFTAKPVADKLLVSAEGLAWRPSPGSPYRFDSFTLKGEIDGPVFAIDDLDLRIFDGRVHGTVNLRSQGRPAMAGEISFERISANRFGAALGLGEQFGGDINGDLRFSATSENWSAILLALYAEGSFTVARGSLGGIDLPEAIRRVSPAPTTLGGETRFEQLTGAIRLTPEHYRFSRLLLNAGTMQSTGQVDVSRDLQLRGRMEVQMRGRSDVAIPVSISGTLKTPLLDAK